jgi:hypothetical protein
MEIHSHGLMSRSVWTLSPSLAASKVTVMQYQRVAQRQPRQKSPANIDVHDLADSLVVERIGDILSSVGTRHESPANGPSMAGYDRGFRWGS